MTVITGKPIPDGLRAILVRILDRAGLPTCRVSSVARTPEAQALAMYLNCRKTGPEVQYGIYKDAGDKIIEVYEQNAMLPKAELVPLMAAKIREVGPSKVSHHCLPDDSPIWVCDISQASVRMEPFLKAAKVDPAYSLLLVENDVFHLEVRKA